MCARSLARLGQHRSCSLTAGIVGVVRIVRPGQQHLAGPDKTAEVVDVAIGLVVVQALGQPDHLADTELRCQLLLNLNALQVRVAPDTSPRSQLELEGRVKPRWAFVGLSGDDGTELHLSAPLKLRGGRAGGRRV